MEHNPPEHNRQEENPSLDELAACIQISDDDDELQQEQSDDAK